MKAMTQKLLNNFLIGIFAVIPIVVVLQIILFIKKYVDGAVRSSAWLRQ